jgi:hypothetical protein
MKLKPTRKMVLARETLRRLETQALATVHGGLATTTKGEDCTNNPTCTNCTSTMNKNLCSQ